MLDHCRLSEPPGSPSSHLSLCQQYLCLGHPNPGSWGRERGQNHPHLRLQPSDVETHRLFDPLGDLKPIAASCRPSEHTGPWRGHPGPADSRLPAWRPPARRLPCQEPEQGNIIGSANNAASQEALPGSCTSEAESTCPRNAVPRLGQGTSPGAGSHSLPRRQQRGLGLAGVSGPLFVPITALGIPAVGTEQGHIEHVQCLTPQEGKCLTQTESQTNQT